MDVSALPTSLSSFFGQTQSTSLRPLELTPLPKPVVAPASPTASTSPVSASTLAGSSTSRFSVNVQLLQISISTQTDGSRRVDAVEHELKLFRREVKGAVKQAFPELEDDARRSVNRLLRQFTRDVRRVGDGSSDGSTDLQSAVETLIGGLRQALPGDGLERLVAKLQDLFQGLGDRVQPASSAAENEGRTGPQSERPSDESDDHRESGFSFSFTALSIQATYQRVQAL